VDYGCRVRDPTARQRLVLDPGRVAEHGDEAGHLAEALFALCERWVAGTGDVGDAFGYPKLTQAYRQTRDAWRAELELYAEALSRFGTDIRTAARRYSDADTRAAARLGGAR
jgi:Excreted virulence factor EspC, type VII ESX diderm